MTESECFYVQKCEREESRRKDEIKVGWRDNFGQLLSGGSEE